nr:DNRLRE domain-containing protein [Arsenicicoccus dermatophilus]
MSGGALLPWVKGGLEGASMSLWMRSSRRVLAAAGVAVVSMVVADGLAVAAPSPTSSGGAARSRAQVARVSSARDVVSARVSARAQGVPVEVSGERTEFSRTWANPDGTLTTKVSAGQTGVKDAKGVWRDVDLTMRQASDGSVAPVMPAVPLRAGGASQGVVDEGVSVGSGDRQVSMGWVGRRSKPVVQGTTSTWPDVMAGVDYRVTATRSGFESFFLVKDRSAVDPTAGLRWTMPLRTKGLRARQSSDGGIDFLDAKGKVASRLEVPMAWDAKVDERTGDPVSRGKVSMRVEQPSPGMAVLTLTVDKAWATDPARVFPITVDPSYATLPAIKPNFDTFVQQGFTDGQSAATELKLGNNGSKQVARSFLQFPMSTLKGLQVKSATLGLYATHSWSCTPKEWGVYSTGGVTSSTVWTNQPAWGDRAAASTVTRGFGAGCEDGWVTQNVTGLVAGWASNGNAYNTLGIRATDEADSFGWKKFASSETTTAPYLSVTYNRKPNAAGAISMPAPAVSYQAPGASTAVLYTPDSTPEFRATATDPDANTVNLVYEVHTSTAPPAGTKPVATCTATAASGAVAACSPATALADNSTYYVRAAVKDDQGLWNGTWSAWTAFRTAWATPPAPVVSCPAPYGTSGSWTDNPPAGPVTCTVSGAGTGSGAPAYIRYRVDGGAEQRAAVTPSADPGVAKVTVTVPATTGGHWIEAWNESITGKTGAHVTHQLGWGNASMTVPAAPAAGVQVAARPPVRSRSRRRVRRRARRPVSPARCSGGCRGTAPPRPASGTTRP